MPTQQAPPQEAEGTQEGSRWINRRPKGEEVADWFVKNVTLHEGMVPERYVTGVVVIAGQEKLKKAVVSSQGQTVMIEEERLAYTPYSKVETRVAYFWDYMALHTDEWLGVIEPVSVKKIGEAGVYNLNMPAGFFRIPVQIKQGIAHYVACSMVVKILKRDTVEMKERVHKVFTAEGVQVEEYTEEYVSGVPIFKYAPAVKMVSATNRYGDDDPFSLMKAETGAVGRALGMAGMLVIPGSGVATAEDMIEALSAGAGGQAVANEEPSLPTAVGASPTKAEQVDTTADDVQMMLAELQSNHADEYDLIAAWAKEKKIDLSAPTDTQLRAVRLKVEKAIRAAKGAAE